MLPPISTLLEELRHSLGIHIAVSFLANDEVGGERADANAGNRFQCVLHIGSCLALLYAKLAFHEFQYALAASYVTGCSSTT